MRDIQGIFDEIQDHKHTRREIGKEYRDTLIQAEGYDELKEEMKKLKEKKRLIETEAKASMGSRWDEFEKAKREIESLEEMMSDIALTSLMKGENINLRDKNDIKYEPTYKVYYKKVN